MTDSGLPTSSLSRSTHLTFRERRPSLEGTSPIAADGGFGPMDYDEDQDGSERDTKETATNTRQEEDIETEDGCGDEFDEFEAGAGDDDFGDFDEGFQQTSETPIEQERPEPQRPPAPVPESPFVSSYTLAIPTTYILYHLPFALDRTPADPPFFVAPNRLLVPFQLGRPNRSHKLPPRRHIPFHQRRRLFLPPRPHPLRNIQPNIPNPPLRLPLGPTCCPTPSPATQLGPLPDSPPLPRLPRCTRRPR